MVPIFGVFDDGRNPDGVEAHFLDIVKMPNQPLVRAATVKMKVRARGFSFIVTSEPIGQNLINCS